MVQGDNNTVVGNIAVDNGGVDLADYGQDNGWLTNTYETANWE